jgi:hypothetical protein
MANTVNSSAHQISKGPRLTISYGPSHPPTVISRRSKRHLKPQQCTGAIAAPSGEQRGAGLASCWGFSESDGSKRKRLAAPQRDGLALL